MKTKLSAFLSVILIIFALSSCYGDINETSNTTNEYSQSLHVTNTEKITNSESTHKEPITDSEEITTENSTHFVPVTVPEEITVEPFTEHVYTPDTEESKAVQQVVTVYITDTGEKYHMSNCRYLKKSCYSISLQEAKNNGYTPCSVCNPPN